MELLDVVDINGEPTSEVVTRQDAHSFGYRHRTSHVWLIRSYSEGYEVLLQKRSMDKDSFPGRYDISSAGHIQAGTSFTESAVRELYEELGITAKESDLIYCGQCYDRRENEFHGKAFIDDQVSNIYILFWHENMVLKLQESEICGSKWIDLDKCMNEVGDDSSWHCIRLNELEMVRSKLREKEYEVCYPSSEECVICKGRCCSSLGCSLSPVDLLKRLGRDTLDEERMLEAIKEYFAIDRMATADGYIYFLRMQHKFYNFIGIDAYGECCVLGSEGCSLTYEERPFGGKSLEAFGYGKCIQHYDREKMERDWRPYRKILSSIWEKYEKQFTEDGTFDSCEEKYMQYQMSRKTR